MADPKSYTAHKLIRLMGRACAAQEMGVDACWLVTIIAHTEDARRYAGPVTFWNDQLQSIAGFGSWNRMNNARKRAVVAGWLTYTAGGKGKVGKYNTSTPAIFAEFPDGPVDEDNLVFLSRSVGQSVGGSGERTGGQRGDNGGTSGDHSSLTLSPNPKDSSKEESSPGNLPVHPADKLRTFPLSTGKVWRLPRKKYDEYEATYGEKFDFVFQLNKARQWLIEHKARRPKANMAAFLTRWMNRVDNFQPRAELGSRVADDLDGAGVYNAETGEIVKPMDAK